MFYTKTPFMGFFLLQWEDSPPISTHFLVEGDLLGGGSLFSTSVLGGVVPGPTCHFLLVGAIYNFLYFFAFAMGAVNGSLRKNILSYIIKMEKIGFVREKCSPWELK